MRVARLMISALLGLGLTLLILESLKSAAASPAVLRPSVSAQATSCDFTTTLTPAKDNTLFESSDGAASSGAGIFIFVGRVGSMQLENTTRRGLMQFNLAGAVPSVATVLTATLRMTITRMPSMTPVPQVVGLHRVLADWGEGTSDGTGAGAPATPGDATWLHRFYTSTLWSTAGGDFVVTPSVTTTVGLLGVYTWTTTPALVADVQHWVDTPAGNYGWLLRGDELTSFTARGFASREAVTDTRPALIVQYRTPQCVFLPVIQK
ncbi:MAG: DNRLRE domain-containing protein [Anaerolineales bacterium]